MKVLIACEESQVVCKAFRDKGHEAYSCDIQDCSGGHPEWHIKDDVLLVMDDNWDLMITHPPCTFLTVSNTYINRGCSKYTKEEAKQYQHEAILFFFSMVDSHIPKIAIENPIGIMSKYYRKPDQIINPYDFGHNESKKTCLWLKNLPLLQITHSKENFLFSITEQIEEKYICSVCGNIFDYKFGKYGCCLQPARIYRDNITKSGQNKLEPSENRSKIRSKTYPGIAQAMANQWG